jgi:NAD(P)-dependent dehydrogenase (short-subunit alcohol dehydrogenase family)
MLLRMTYLWPAGVVLFNSSVAGGPTCMRSGAIYAMTKAALNQLTRNLACEWASAGIRVNTVAPWVRPCLSLIHLDASCASCSVRLARMLLTDFSASHSCQAWSRFCETEDMAICA